MCVSGKSAMFIDDDDAFLMLVERVCTRDIKEVKSSFHLDGETAISHLRLNVLRDGFPEFIFVDVNMPNMSGFEFLKELIQIKVDYNLHQRLPNVVMLTSSNDDRDKKRSFDIGVKSYIIKPNHLNELHDVLASFLCKS